MGVCTAKSKHNKQPPSQPQPTIYLQSPVNSTLKKENFQKEQTIISGSTGTGSGSLHSVLKSEPNQKKSFFSERTSSVNTRLQFDSIQQYKSENPMESPIQQIQQKNNSLIEKQLENQISQSYSNSEKGNQTDLSFGNLTKLVHNLPTNQQPFDDSNYKIKITPIKNKPESINLESGILEISKHTEGLNYYCEPSNQAMQTFSAQFQMIPSQDIIWAIPESIQKQKKLEDDQLNEVLHLKDVPDITSRII